HEREDGSGYPCGLTGKRIPLGAKIISIADCFDALTSDRSYQKAGSLDNAIGILRKLRGKVLSRELTDAFISEIRETGIISLLNDKDHAL
ncbi:MAG: phosphohydrolase, partial [Deltaproteobacteria bacterium]|nr:phosphohydrolase [Deltaproteobacteria bacterium]